MEHNHSSSVCVRIRNQFQRSSTVSFLGLSPDAIFQRSSWSPSLQLPAPGDAKCVQTRGREAKMHITVESREVILFAVEVLLETVSHIAQVDWESGLLTLYILNLKQVYL